ncbi:uncharacterized protein LOC105834717 [Monomorium pharaonis]|uniref:uncharacterized protein LOC105834717 n=1 Tax=Monomorium pharaonis TaxID=307658 RepID=UPI00063F5648|nr:uncharacterized protein LOC105834717 [Monomorium pharaonis]
MARNGKKKLAIFVGTSKCLIYAEAKYCASDMPGEIKYYECSRTEYCCAFGCCVSPGFHFHHLWYYWILVIIMFLVCSGGGWWYRYWLQGRYRAAASAIPTRSSNRSQNSLRNTPCQAQQARITYNSARNTVLLHRMWKGPQRNTAAPAYNGNATTSTHYQNMNVVLNDTNCPYYQLYGPPPSYETVIAQTRGKLSNPASPESSGARLNLQTANVIPNPSVPQCFFYSCNSPARLVDGNVSQCQNDNINAHQLDGHEGVPFAHFSQYCATNAVGQGMCIYPEESAASGGSSFTCSYQNSPHRLPGYSMDRPSDHTSDAENVARGYEIPSTEEHTMLNIDAATSGFGEHSPWHGNDQSLLRVHGKSTVQDENRASQKRCVTTDTCTLSPKSESGSKENKFKRTFNVPETQRNFSRERTNYGGSLRLPRRHAGSVVYQSDSFQKVLPGDSSSASQRNTFNSDGANSLELDANSSQSNPSNNVILESFIFENVQLPPSESVEEARGLYAMNRASANFDLESKHKLDRSKSLD